MSDLQMLLDERAIVQGLGLFARMIDDKRWADASEIFAEDVSFDYGLGGEQQGLNTLRQWMSSFLDTCGNTQHLIGSILVNVDGDNAVSRSYVMARHQRPDDPQGPVQDSNGEYIDRWERRVQGWRIVRRDAVWAMRVGEAEIFGRELKD